MKCLIVSLCTIVSVCAYAYDTSYDALYTAATGYVTLDGNDSGNGDNSSFHSSKNWSDKREPHSGTNYYVKASKTLYLDHVSNTSTPEGFAGDSLVVAGQVQMDGAWGSVANCGELTMLPDSSFRWITIGNIVGGSIHIKGTGTSTIKPVSFLSGRGAHETNLYSINALMSFSSDPDAELYWHLYSGKETGVSFVVLDDWTSFLGTFRIGNNFIIKPQNGSYRIPGNLIISTNAMLRLTATEGYSEIGALSILSNGVLNLSAVNSKHIVKITKKLELEPGALVIPQSFSGTSIEAVEFHPVFELTAEAVAQGLPDFASIPVAFSGRKQAIKNGHEPDLTIFPGLNWVVRDSESGGKIVGFSYKEVVSAITNMGWNKNGFVENGTDGFNPANYWTDGKYPHKGTCYYNNGKTLMIQKVGIPYLFPGDSLTVYRGVIACYSDGRDITINDLILGGAARFRLMSQNNTYHLRGKIRVVGDHELPTFKFRNGDKCTHYIDSDISGDGLLSFGMDTEVGDENWNKTLTCGIYELSGNNSAFHGKITVDCWQTVSSTYKQFFEEEEPYQPGPCSNITLRVSNQLNLGGTLPSFEYDALTVSNQCRLTLLSTAEFNDLTRGWFFPENAYLCVEEGAIATVKNPITYGQKLVKEGNGTLMLGGSAAIASGVVNRPQFKVDKGTLGFVSSTAINGLNVSFAEGTSLRVQAVQMDDVFASKGVDLTNADITSDSTINLDVDMTGVDMYSVGQVTIPICTVPESRVLEYEDLFTVGKVVSGCSSEFTWVSNSDSTKTLCLTVTHNGFVISIR